MHKVDVAVQHVMYQHRYICVKHTGVCWETKAYWGVLTTVAPIAGIKRKIFFCIYCTVQKF